MIKIYLISFLFFCAAGLAAQNSIDTLRLNSSYRALLRNPNSVELQKEFFEAFPNAWNAFLQTYDYYPKGDLNMYNLAYDHIVNGLGKFVTLLPDTVYCDKLIKLSVGGKWNADAPNYLQMVIRQTMKNKLDTMFQRLSLLPQKDVLSFWYFLFNSLHVTKEQTLLYSKLHDSMQTKYPMIIEEMKKAFVMSSGKAH